MAAAGEESPLVEQEVEDPFGFLDEEEESAVEQGAAAAAEFLAAPP